VRGLKRKYVWKTPQKNKRQKTPNAKVRRLQSTKTEEGDEKVFKSLLEDEINTARTLTDDDQTEEEEPVGEDDDALFIAPAKRTSNHSSPHSLSGAPRQLIMQVRKQMGNLYDLSGGIKPAKIEICPGWRNHLRAALDTVRFDRHFELTDIQLAILREALDKVEYAVAQDESIFRIRTARP